MMALLTAPIASPRPKLWRRIRLLAAAVFAVTVAWAVQWTFWHHHAKRFMEVRKGVFYRLAQPSELGLDYLVKWLGVKTVVSVQLYDFRLYQGIVSFGGPPDGCRESEYVRRLGARPVQWPMGVEKSWPWMTPWQFEEFFNLVDDPANWPIAIHCQGGRHRTGTLSALFRLEYDRWPVEKALAEMYTFKFGGAIRLQECNLRTYLPRPHPDAAEWAALESYWSPRLGGKKLADYEALIRSLRGARHNGRQLDEALAGYFQERRTFSLPLAQRLMDAADPLAPLAADMAAEALESFNAGRASWSTAAALVADFGAPDQQRRLLAILSDGDGQRASPERFDAIVDGVTNRYTPNRVAYLRPLLDNEACHLRAGAEQCRYCDTAVARLSAIVDENFPDAVPGWGIDAWNNGRKAARAWLDAHPDDCQLSKLKPPTGRTKVLPGDPSPREDLSRARL